MFCSKCGKEHPEDTKFCSFCGQPTSQDTNTNSFDTVSSNSRSYKKWALPMYVVYVIAIVLIIVIIVNSLSSPKSLEKELTKHTWYYVDTDGYYGGPSLEVLEFHLDGKRDSQEYHYYNGEWNEAGDADNLSNSWKIMEDRELHFKGRYYEWKEDWNLSGSTLTIGEQKYTNKPPSNYPD